MEPAATTPGTALRTVDRGRRRQTDKPIHTHLVAHMREQTLRKRALWDDAYRCTVGDVYWTEDANVRLHLEDSSSSWKSLLCRAPGDLAASAS